MKKITLLFTLLITAVSFGQTPVLTMISDGDCSGGTPKIIEIYADGTVDFSLYSVEKQSNGGTWGSTTNLASFGTVTDDFIYIYSDSSTPEVFPTEYPSATNSLEDAVVNINGDDGIRIIEDSSSTVIDQYGVDGVDGSGETWEYEDGYAKRNDSSAPNGSFNQGDWSFNNNALVGEGLCNGANSFESIIGIGTFTPGTVSCPLVITLDNVSCDTETQGATSDTYTVTGSFTGGGTENYTFTINDGTVTSTDDISTMSSGTITVSNIPEGTDFTYTITSTSCNIQATITSPECEPSINVSDISELRQGTIGDTYTLTGEAFLTFQRDYRNQKYIQDATAAILLDDDAENITSTYTIGDGITGVTGELSEYNGVLQFIPESDPGAATSSGNTITPQIITIDDLNNNPDEYESELIALQNITISDITDGDGTWQAGENYDITNGSETTILRTNFFDADYIGEQIPTTSINLVGLGAEFDNGTDPAVAQIFPRNNNDIDANLSVGNVTTSEFSLYPNPTSTGAVQIKTASNTEAEVAIFNILGQKVLAQKLTSNAVNVSTLQSGVYLVKIIQDGKATTKKLIIE